MMIAKDRGINIVERKKETIEDFANLISVEVETGKAQSLIMGTLYTKTEPRVVKVDNCYVEAIPKGHMLVIYNKDVPGIVGHIGTLLGDAKINIAGMTFGREKPGGKAISLINVDSEVPKSVLEKIKKAKNISEVKYIKL
jgi:D-3-phosphoglycerate dehydrogenase